MLLNKAELLSSKLLSPSSSRLVGDADGNGCGDAAGVSACKGSGWTVESPSRSPGEKMRQDRRRARSRAQGQEESGGEGGEEGVEDASVASVEMAPARLQLPGSHL